MTGPVRGHSIREAPRERKAKSDLENSQSDSAQGLSPPNSERPPDAGSFPFFFSLGLLSSTSVFFLRRYPSTPRTAATVPSVRLRALPVQTRSPASTRCRAQFRKCWWLRSAGTDRSFLSEGFQKVKKTRECGTYTYASRRQVSREPKLRDNEGCLIWRHPLSNEGK